ncbi:hypothetical protein [Moorena producens]|uniref:hypothetical protein n=1 Tax=Moorena producens TaxID=1155739 RepID=UPI001E558938|nr:hypothetical protein [Moorena producens]
MRSRSVTCTGFARRFANGQSHLGRVSTGNSGSPEQRIAMQRLNKGVSPLSPHSSPDSRLPTLYCTRFHIR